MFKKFIAAILLTFVLISNADASTTESRMLKDLLGYVSRHEMMYSDILWALDYIEEFDRQRTWQALQLARASVAIAMSNVQHYKYQNTDMTANDYTKLIKRKIDVSFLENAEAIFGAERTELRNCLVNLKNAVMYEFFFKEDWDICMRNVANRRKEMQYRLQYLADMVDWVLTSLNKPAMSKIFNGSLEKLCPKTQALRRKKPESIEKIEADSKSNLDKLEQLMLDDSKIVGAKTDRLNTMKYALDKKDTKLISTQPLKISNMPPLIHFPNWFNNDHDIHYFWKDSSGTPKIPPSCTKFERLPDSCLVRVNNVSLSQVKAYQKELENDGLRASGSQEQGGKYYLFYKVKGGSFAIIWENNRAGIHMNEDPVCFIPYLYLLMLRRF